MGEEVESSPGGGGAVKDILSGTVAGFAQVAVGE